MFVRFHEATAGSIPLPNWDCPRWELASIVVRTELSREGECKLRRLNTVDAEHAAVVRSELHKVQTAPAEVMATVVTFGFRLRWEVVDLGVTPRQPLDRAEPPRTARMLAAYMRHEMVEI